MNRKAIPDARDLRPASSTFVNGWLDDSCFVGKSYRSGSITVVLNGFESGAKKKTSLRKTTWICCSFVLNLNLLYYYMKKTMHYLSSKSYGQGRSDHQQLYLLQHHQSPVSGFLLTDPTHTHSRTTVVGWWVVVTSTNLGQIYNSTIESQRTQTTITTIPGQCPNSCIILQDSYGVRSPKVKSKTIKRSLRRTYKQRRSRCASESVFLSIEYVNRILAHKAARPKANL